RARREATVDWREQGAEQIQDNWANHDAQGGREAEATLILPTVEREAPRWWQRGGRLSHWQIGLAAALVVVMLTGATFLISWAPRVGDSGAGHSLATPATRLDTSGLAAIPPTVAPTRTPEPRSTPTPRAPVHTTLGELCQDIYKFVPHIVEWTVPPGCYATIYSPDPAAYPFRPGF